MNHERTRMRGVVIDALRPFDGVSVENGARLGTPDVNCTLGWLELKYEESWPVRPETPLRVDHFTAQQRTWIGRRARAGGFVAVVLKVGKASKSSWFILPGDWAALHLGKRTKAEIEEAAEGKWTTFNRAEFRVRLAHLAKRNLLESVSPGERPSF